MPRKSDMVKTNTRASAASAAAKEAANNSNDEHKAEEESSPSAGTEESVAMSIDPPQANPKFRHSMSAGSESSESLPIALNPSLVHSNSLALPSSVMQLHKQAGVGGLPTTVAPPSNVTRFATAGPFPSSPNFPRQLSRNASTSNPLTSLSTVGAFASEWRAQVAVEERINIRRKLREAYFKNCTSYEQLLDTVVAIDEELLFACSSNRIDYFKSSIDWDSRIQLKRQQLKGSSASSSGLPAGSTQLQSHSSLGSASSPTSRKRNSEELQTNNSDLLPSTSALSTILNESDSTTSPKLKSESSIVTEEQPQKKQKN